MSTNPYRIIVTAAQSKYARLALCRVYRDTNPTRIKSPLVEEILDQRKAMRPPGTPVGVCMPERPRDVVNNYTKELLELYEIYDMLVAAPAEGNALADC